jgi:hypothetical protein
MAAILMMVVVFVAVVAAGLAAAKRHTEKTVRVATSAARVARSLADDVDRYWIDVELQTGKFCLFATYSPSDGGRVGREEVYPLE